MRTEPEFAVRLTGWNALCGEGRAPPRFAPDRLSIRVPPLAAKTRRPPSAHAAARVFGTFRACIKDQRRSREIDTSLRHRPRSRSGARRRNRGRGSCPGPWQRQREWERQRTRRAAGYGRADLPRRDQGLRRVPWGRPELLQRVRQRFHGGRRAPSSELATSSHSRPIRTSHARPIDSPSCANWPCLSA